MPAVRGLWLMEFMPFLCIGVRNRAVDSLNNLNY